MDIKLEISKDTQAVKILAIDNGKALIGKGYGKYLPRKKANLNLISGLEKEHIDDVLNRLSDKTARELSDYSHLDTPWLITGQNKLIDYEAVFYRTANTSVREYERD